ncbi:MAG: hypothetical protein ABEJ22_01455 [Haloferacaceae archaeon]
MSEQDPPGGLVTFRALEDPPGVEIRDEGAGLTYEMRTDAPVTLSPAAADSFPFPVDDAVAFTAERLRIPRIAGMVLRAADGDHLGGFVDVERLPRDTYYLEVGSTSKTYVRFEDVAVRGFYPDVDAEAEVVFSLATPARVVVGTRSAHTRPNGVVETPADPEAMMEAFSHLGSSLKELSPERSWPTLRGHPPAVEVGDELDVPSHLTPPETGISLALPPTYEHVYAAAPLAYYLGATMVPGEAPALQTPSGLNYRLETSGESFENAVDRVLVQCFVLDTLTRVGGYYDFDRHEYEYLAPHLPFYPPSLYDEPVWKQVEQYLEVDFSDLAPHLPRWPARATLRPVPEDATAIPWLLDDLALVHTGPTGTDRDKDRRRTVVTGRFETTGRSQCGERSLAVPPTGAVDASRPDLSLVADYDAFATSGIPAGDCVLVEEAYERRRDRRRWDVDDAPVTVVCNEETRRDAVERAAESYRTRTDPPPLDFETAHDVTVAELRERLRSERALLLYVGPTTESGFECADGVLEVDSLDECNVTAFVLASATTPDLGVELVERGADAGLVTLSAPRDDGVVDTGGRIADFLNAGYPFAAVVDIVDFAGEGVEYVLVGDGGLELTRREAGEPMWYVEVDSRSTDEHEVAATAFLGSEHKIGAVAVNFADPDYDNVQLFSSCVRRQNTTRELVEYLGPQLAVRLNDDPVRRGDGVDASDVVDSVK